MTTRTNGLTTSHRSGLALVLLAVMSVIAFPTAASANHSWGGYHWARTANPFTLKLGDNVSGAWDLIDPASGLSILATTSSDWSVSSVVDTTIVTGSANPKNCRPTAGGVQVCNAKYGNNGWLGLAQIWISGGTHITQGVVKLNDTYFNTAKYNTTAWRNLVSCQEVGHTLGLDHQDEAFDNVNLGTCMDYTNDPSTNQHPNGHDYEQLETIYNSHTDTSTTLASSPGASNADVRGQSEWGHAVAQSSDDRTIVYERDFGAGEKVVTFVIWA